MTRAPYIFDTLNTILLSVYASILTATHCAVLSLPLLLAVFCLVCGNNTLYRLTHTTTVMSRSMVSHTHTRSPARSLVRSQSDTLCSFLFSPFSSPLSLCCCTGKAVSVPQANSSCSASQISCYQQANGQGERPNRRNAGRPRRPPVLLI